MRGIRGIKALLSKKRAGGKDNRQSSVESNISEKLHYYSCCSNGFISGVNEILKECNVYYDKILEEDFM